MGDQIICEAINSVCKPEWDNRLISDILEEDRNKSKTEFEKAYDVLEAWKSESCKEAKKICKEPDKIREAHKMNIQDWHMQDIKTTEDLENEWAKIG